MRIQVYVALRGTGALELTKWETLTVADKVAAHFHCQAVTRANANVRRAAFEILEAGQ